MSTDNVKCTCNEGEFYSQVCPIHGSTVLKDGYNKGMTIINDGYLMSSQPVNIQGFPFQCPVCKVAAIFVNSQYIPKLCPECGTSIQIQSATLTNFVRSGLT